MVHLPGTNRWLKTFTKKELYKNCEDCVKKCKSDMAGDKTCGSFMADIWKQKFPNGPPHEVMCTNDYLKDQITNKNYPLVVKNALYKRKRLRADDDYHQPSDWKVPGVNR